MAMKNLEPYLEITYAGYAMEDTKSIGGRIVPIVDEHDVSDFRTQFQRDRDRIIHSQAFRRLESKTQTLLSHGSDQNRKRLMHSLEVFQLSETIAYNLGLNIFLTQAIALGHDLGHPPFGHGGEEVLAEILRDFNRGGFKHNYQSVLVVNKLEKEYEEGHGLNLMWETRDGILKHSGLNDRLELGYYDDTLLPEPDFPLSMEGQVVRIVNKIAQRTQDTEDGVLSGRLHFHELLDQAFIKEVLVFADKYTPDQLQNLYEINSEQALFVLLRSMIKCYVADLLANTRATIEQESIQTFDDVVKHKDHPIVDFHAAFRETDHKFKERFLKPRFYDNYEVKRMNSRGRNILKQLFWGYKENPKQLPQWTFDAYVSQIASDIKKRIEEGQLDQAVQKFLDSAPLPCESGCLYVPNSKKYQLSGGNHDEALDFADCPLQGGGSKNRKACEGIRVIINHIAGMSDGDAIGEYARFFLPPEIS